MRTLFLIIISFTFLTEIKSQNLVNTKIIAHRGAWKANSLPQNSIASLKNAIKLGFFGSEFDVRMTKDEVLVINHDPHFEGMDIENTIFNDLRKVNLKNGEKLPTLKEYLKAGKKQNKTMLITEIKPSPAGKERSLLLAEKTVKMIEKLKMQKKVVYISFDYDILKKVHELSPNAHTQYLNGGISPQQIQADGLTGVDYHFSIFQNDEDWLQNAHKQGISTNAWTVNDPEIMNYLMARNIQFITTDEPEKATQIAEIWKLKAKKLVWSDEFNYTGLPKNTKWNYDLGGHGWGNNELQFYTANDTSTAFVKNNVLTIKANKKVHENKNYTSARLVTRGLASWKYGRVEVRAKLPKGRGTWPAIWMLADDIETVGWPKAGEIDIMEHVGYDPDTLVGTVHTQTYNHVKGTQKSKKIFFENPYTQFHTYAMEWDSEKMDFIYDDKVYFTIKNEHKTDNEWPFDKPYHLILNLAIGGNWGGAKGIDPNIFPAKYEIDYVRIFQ